MFVKGGETIEKSDSAVPQTSGQPGQDGSGSEIKRVVTRDGRPAVELFVHLDGEALHVALLVLNRNRECWRDIADELSAYYNTPGRLAVFAAGLKMRTDVRDQTQPRSPWNWVY